MEIVVFSAVSCLLFLGGLRRLGDTTKTDGVTVLTVVALKINFTLKILSRVLMEDSCLHMYVIILVCLKQCRCD
jgi:hypothetical protein